MANSRAWSLTTVGKDQQYAGNQGYADDPERVYRYDSKVQNHRNISVGDLVLIRDRQHLLGVAQVETIEASKGTKSISRCPECGIGNIKARQAKVTRFRCANGHEFDDPRVDEVDVSLFAAYFSKSYVKANDAVTVSEIKAAAPRRSDQMSIEEIDVRKLEKALIASSPATRPILASFFQTNTLNASESDEQSSAQVAEATLPFSASVSDTRREVLRAIKERRGQRKFRNALLGRYAAKCVVSGCALIDVLEAAHIWPYRGDEDNNPQNGLLLRADIHTLYDLDLIAIHPETLEIEIAPSLTKIDTYACLQGRQLSLPVTVRPASEPLTRRWEVFSQRHRKGL